jgi:hypothetical protein
LPALPAAVKTEALPAPPAETAADKPVLVGTN